MRTGKRFGMLRPLKGRDFRHVWLGEIVATAGATFNTLITAVLVLRLSPSGLTLGLVLLVGGLPRILFMLLGGSASDRLSPRTVMLASYLSRAVLLIGLGMLVATGRLELWHLYVSRLLYGIADAIFVPSVSAIIPRVVTRDELPAANSLHRVVLGAGVVGGNAIAGILIVTAGPDAATFGAAGAFLLAAIALSTVRLTPVAPAAGAPTRGGTLRSVGDGLRYLWPHREMRYVLLLTAGLTLVLAGPINIGFPSLAELRFHDASVMGTIFAAYGVGTIAGSLLPGLLARRVHRHGLALVTLAAAFGGGVALLGLVPGVLTAAAVAVLIGAAGASFNIIALTILQERTDPAYLGRVMSWFSVSGYGINPLSNLLTGVAVDISVGGMFVCFGAIAVGVSALGLATPAISRITSEKVEDVPAPMDRTAAPKVA